MSFREAKIIKGSREGMVVRVFGAWQQGNETIINCFTPDGKRLRLSANMVELLPVQKVVATNNHVPMFDFDYKGGGTSRNMTSAKNQVPKNVDKDGVERYTGVMIHSHKTGASIEIKQGDKLVHAAETFNYKNRQ